MNYCWMFPHRPPVFIVLGRYGDIIQLLPCFMAIYNRTKQKPIVMVSAGYADVLEGVSYVTPHVIKANWYMGIPAARQIAEAQYGGGLVAQWWNDSPERIQMIEEATKGGLVLQCHGHEWGVDINRWPNYGTSMADRCGFNQREWKSLPLVFDKRDHAREASLVRRVVGGDNRPMLLYNVSGHSSPFGYTPNVLNPIIARYKRDLNLVDLGRVKAHRIYDLLGLFDRAIGLITTDTSTLHLAPAAQCEYVAFTVGGWTQSVPKGKCVLQITYDHTPGRVGEVLAVIDKWKERAHGNHSRMVAVHAA